MSNRRAAIYHHLRIDEDGGLDTFVLQRVWETRTALGAQLFNAILRGLVLADRLNTSALFASRVSNGNAGTPKAHPSVNPQGDEMQMLFWASTAWMREFSEVVDDLASAGIEGLLRLDSEYFEQLRAITARWKTEIFAQMRNQVGVHLDARVIERGLKLTRASGDTSAKLLHIWWTRPEERIGDSNIRATFAHEVLLAGLFAPPWSGEANGAPISAKVADAIAKQSARNMEKTVSQAITDHGSLPALMRGLIVDIAKALQLGERPVPVPVTKEASHREIIDRTKQGLDVVGRLIQGWDHRQDNIAKARCVGDELQKLRAENKALKAEIRTAKRTAVSGPGSKGAPGP